ncbi:MAG: 7-cyano-7-deazaguanine reductase [Chloroflexia bacterium]|jgi:7-cyano-7-deazaguanine reductase|nr:7-cyano-7-deazaguanine reductase [Chloroflexia bacterium]
MASIDNKQKHPQNGANGEFRFLGKDVAEFQGFDTFPTPANVENVTMTSDEVTALCPITGQPDWYTVTISYDPKKAEDGGRCLESKSLKLYLQSYRNEGLFCEAFAGKIADDVFEALGPSSVVVTVDQKPRGGIGIVAKAQRSALSA